MSIALTLGAAPAHAWGNEGHRAVGELAFAQLSPEAQTQVLEALTEPGYETLADAATWPDTYARNRREYAAMKPFHYVNIDPGAPSYSSTRDCPTGCVVSALTQFIALLETSDPAPTLAQRRSAIYWIAHLMGDLHQPLHVAHPDNKGGTTAQLTFFDAKRPRSAHWVWDSGLIERRPRSPAPEAGTPDPGSPRDDHQLLVDELSRGLSPAMLKAFQRTLSPEAIANESLNVARRWAFLRGGDHVDQAYVKSRWPVVAEQLRKAGSRLAAVLERALVRAKKPAKSGL